MTNTITPASNADVLSKYGRATIMKSAWRTFKTAAIVLRPVTFSDALRSAWADFRAAIDRAASRAAKTSAFYNANKNKSGLLGRVAHAAKNPPSDRDAWGRNSSRYLNTVMGR